mmetsp:Transcript_135271/g.289234  ORF Transcript_135271/g.289234 Transcript_135271/m.289234 type:complete len:230 (-) Transcript_135271:272-961(-)
MHLSAAFVITPGAVAAPTPFLNIQVADPRDEQGELPRSHPMLLEKLQRKEVPKALEQALNFAPDATAEESLTEELEILGLVLFRHCHGCAAGQELLWFGEPLRGSRHKAEVILLTQGCRQLRSTPRPEYRLHTATEEVWIKPADVVHHDRAAQKVFAHDEAEGERQGPCGEHRQSYKATSSEERAPTVEVILAILNAITLDVRAAAACAACDAGARHGPWQECTVRRGS